MSALTAETDRETARESDRECDRDAVTVIESACRGSERVERSRGERVSVARGEALLGYHCWVPVRGAPVIATVIATARSGQTAG